jgi:hypothetical protein
MGKVVISLFQIWRINGAGVCMHGVLLYRATKLFPALTYSSL